MAKSSIMRLKAVTTPHIHFIYKLTENATQHARSRDFSFIIVRRLAFLAIILVEHVVSLSTPQTV